MIKSTTSKQEAEVFIEKWYFSWINFCEIKFCEFKTPFY